MNPYKLSQVYKQLTSQNSILKKYLKLGTKDLKQPDLPAFVETKNAVNRFVRDNPRPDQIDRKDMAGGGMLVKPSADGSRPGYATPGTGANQFTVMKEKAEKFLKGKKEVKQSDFIKELKKIGYKDPQAFSSVIANRNNVKLIRDVSLKRSPNIEAVMNELSALTFDYNEKVLKDFNNENMSKTPSWSEYLKNKKLKHGSVKYYQGASSKGFNIFDAQKKRLELAEKVVKDANQNSFNYSTISL